MADSAVAITQGSGTNIDTRTEATNGNHRQVVVIGDPSTNLGVAPVNATSGLKVDLGSDNDVVLGAGASIVGTVGIDQSTPGTTNGVQVNAALPAGSNNIGDVDVASIATGNNVIGQVKITDGAEVASVDTSNRLEVAVGNTVAVSDGAGSLTVDAVNLDIRDLTSASDSIVAVQPTAGNLNMTEANSGAIKTAVELIDNCISGNEAQVDIVASLPAGTNAIGKILPPDVDVTTHTNYIRKYYTAATPTDGIVWSPAAGKRWHVTTLYINTSAASTITLEDDKAGGDDPVWKGEIAANSGVVLTFDPMYPMASGEDEADLIITSTAGTVYVTAVGYEI